MRNHFLLIVGVTLTAATFVMIAAIMADSDWRGAQRYYVDRLDSSLARAQEKAQGGEMLRELGGWLSTFEQLKISSAYDPVRVRVTELRNELLVAEESPGATLLKRERVRAKIGAIPRIGARAFAESHSWWSYLMVPVALLLGIPALMLLGLYLLVRSPDRTKTAPAAAVDPTASRSEGTSRPSTGSRGADDQAVQVFTTAMINQSGARESEARRL